MTTIAQSRRIDNLIVGACVRLQFNNADEEIALFAGISGEGDERRARFVQVRESGAVSDWEAYRYLGRWAYGSSAQSLKVTEVIL